MKKILLLMFGVLMALPTFARDFEYEYQGQTLVYYVMGSKTVSVRADEPVSGDLIIPAIVKDGDTDYTVTEISHDAFSGCSGLTSVTIPNSVTKISKDAFTNCSSLTSVTIPNSVETIGYGAFRDCTGLTSVTIPTSVRVLGDYAFSGCSRLTEVTIPNSVSLIGEGCVIIDVMARPLHSLLREDGVFSGDGFLRIFPKKSILGE